MRDFRPFAVVLVALAATVVLSTAVMGGMVGGPMTGPGMMWGYGSQAGTPGISGWGGALAMGTGWVMMLALWGALIVEMVLLIRWATGSASHQNTKEVPLTILQRRYASGEIDEETYRRIRGELVGDHESSHPMRQAS